MARGEVTGTVKGHDRVQIAATAKVRGEIITKSIAIEERAELHGVRVNLERKDERPVAAAAEAFEAQPDSSVTVALAEKVPQVHR